MMHMHSNHTERKTRARDERGFTLLIAALIASIVLALGASIFQIAQKQLTLSSIGRDSQFAFYAADTGAECALYWDSRFQRFPTSTPTSVNLTCDGDNNPQISTSATNDGGSIVSTFQFEPNGYCVDVAVAKTFVPAQNSIRTEVRADGFSTSCAGIAGSSRVLQRSVELNF